jgi:hypothetical protein
MLLRPSLRHVQKEMCCEVYWWLVQPRQAVRNGPPLQHEDEKMHGQREERAFVLHKGFPMPTRVALPRCQKDVHKRQCRTVVQLGRGKWVKSSKTPHIPTPYVWNGTISTTRAVPQILLYSPCNYIKLCIRKPTILFLHMSLNLIWMRLVR